MTSESVQRTVRVLTGPSMVIDPAEVVAVERGGGVSTVPYIGAWNCAGASFTTGVTRFSVGSALAMHFHNVDESVLILSGEATAEVGDERVGLVPGEATWVPAGVPHRFVNRGTTEMSIYWIYGGRDVTRTIVATGETMEHLTELGRGAGRR